MSRLIFALSLTLTLAVPTLLVAQEFEQAPPPALSGKTAPAKNDRDAFIAACEQKPKAQPGSCECIAERVQSEFEGADYNLIAALAADEKDVRRVQTLIGKPMSPDQMTAVRQRFQTVRAACEAQARGKAS